MKVNIETFEYVVKARQKLSKFEDENKLTDVINIDILGEYWIFEDTLVKKVLNDSEYDWYCWFAFENDFGLKELTCKNQNKYKNGINIKSLDDMIKFLKDSND
jgi:hypothetical protein